MFIIAHVFGWMWVRVAILVIAIVPEVRPTWLLNPSLMPLLILSSAILLAAYCDNEMSHFLQATELGGQDVLAGPTQAKVPSLSQPAGLVAHTRPFHTSARGLHALNSLMSLVLWLLALVAASMVPLAYLLKNMGVAISTQGSVLVMVLLGSLLLRCIVLGRAFRHKRRRAGMPSFSRSAPEDAEVPDRAEEQSTAGGREVMLSEGPLNSLDAATGVLDAVPLP